MLNRYIIPGLENRILVGIIIFVATMILVGWVAINETARMASFEEQHLARSIERGAELFASNCTTCHGLEGRGIAEFAPGLNNPQLFGFVPVELEEVNNAILRLQNRIVELQDENRQLQTERDEIFAELAEGVDAEREAEILARMNEIDATILSNNEAIPSLEEEAVPLIEERQPILDSLEPALIAGYLPGIEALDGVELSQQIDIANDRLSQFGWGGSLEGYVLTTLIHGRPGSGGVWNGNQMSAWSQTAGGPLRDDQLQDITNYILNWDKGDNWTLEDFFLIEQYGKPHGDGSVPTVQVDTISDTHPELDVVAIASDLAEGDATRGEALYNGDTRTEANNRLGCSGCHLGGAAAPDTEGTWTRVNNERLAESQFSGYTAEQYLVESIIHPNDYVVDGYASGAMPLNFAEQFTIQDLSDMIAFLATQE